MSENPQLIQTIYAGWGAYQEAVIRALRPLNAEQLALHAGPKLRTVDAIARHIIGARARWFYLLMGEGGEEFKSLGRWDHRDGRPRSAEELVGGLERTWQGMQAAIARWSPEDWEKTWPGEGDDEPEILTRQWVIWHLIEHDLYHGGEISITLGTHGISAVNL